MPRLALLLSTLVWGATFPATKAVLEQLPPFAFLFLRFFLATIVGVGVAWAWQGRLRTDRMTLRLSAIASLFMFVGYACQTVGLRYTTASNSAFITALYVVMVPLFLRRFEPRTWLSASLAVVGLWLLVHPAWPTIPPLSTVPAWTDLLRLLPVVVNVGDLWTLACAAAFAAHIACLESYTRRSDAVSLFAWQLVFVTAAMLVSYVLEPGDSLNAMLMTPTLAVALMVTAVLATGAFAVQIWAQRLVPAQRVALIFSLEPAVAAWLAWYFLGEQLDALAWLGSGLILAAVILGAARLASVTIPQDVPTGTLAEGKR